MGRSRLALSLAAACVKGLALTSCTLRHPQAAARKRQLPGGGSSSQLAALAGAEASGIVGGGLQTADAAGVLDGAMERLAGDRSAGAEGQGGGGAAGEPPAAKKQLAFAGGGGRADAAP